MPDNKPTPLPVDPDVKVPAAVKAAAARAEQIHAEAYQTGEQNAGPNSGNGGDTGNTGSNGGASSSDTISLAPPTRSTPSPTPNENKFQAPEVGRDSSPSGGGQEQTHAPRVDDWEHRYNSERGRKAQLENENRALAARLASMEATMAALQAPPQGSGNLPTASNPDLRFGGPRAQPVQVPSLDKFQLTPEERQDYGEEFLNVIGKQAAQTIVPMLEQVRQENEQLRRNLAQMGASANASAKQTLEGFMDTSLPTWRQLNRDPKFLEWLGLTDPYSGVRKQDLLTAAYERNDANRVLAFFNGFLADEAATAPPDFQPNGNGNQPPKIPLEQLAAPGRAKTAAGPGAPAEKPTISRDQITAFYAQVAAGRFRGNEAEKNRLEGMIFEAQRENRIR